MAGICFGLTIKLWHTTKVEKSCLWHNHNHWIFKNKWKLKTVEKVLFLWIPFLVWSCTTHAWSRRSWEWLCCLHPFCDFLNWIGNNWNVTDWRYSILIAKQHNCFISQIPYENVAKLDNLEGSTRFFLLSFNAILFEGCRNCRIDFFSSLNPCDRVKELINIGSQFRSFPVLDSLIALWLLSRRIKGKYLKRKL